MMTSRRSRRRLWARWSAWKRPRRRMAVSVRGRECVGCIVLLVI
jgi:hypothetical protein